MSGEGFEAKYIARVAASNGICIVMMLGLLRLLSSGRAQFLPTYLVSAVILWLRTERPT